LYGRVIKPAGFQAGKKYPVIVSGLRRSRGDAAGRESMVREYRMDQVYATKATWCGNARIAAGMGRGHRFETAIFRNLGAAELADQVAE